MTFPGLLSFELRYQTRRVAFIAASLLAAALGFVLVSTGYGPSGVDIGSPYVITQSLGILSLPAIFTLTVFCAEAALRDVEHGMTELVFATPIGKPRWLAARFGGAALAGFSGLVLADLVLIVAPFVVAVEPDRQGPLRLGAHLWALGVIALPNLLFVSALLFAIATLTRSTIATYVAAVAIYGLYWVTALLVDSPLMAGTAPPTREALARAALLDPFGLSAFFEQTRYWTVAERDVRPVTLTGRMLLNRALWLGVTGAVLAFAYARFAFRVSADAGRRPEAAEDTADHAPDIQPVAPALPSSGPRASVHAFGSALRVELRLLLRGWTFAALALLWAFVGGMEATAQLGGEYGSTALATTSLLLSALQEPLLLLGTVAIAYYATESAWRERAVGIDQIVDATAMPVVSRQLAKLSALAILALALGVIAIGVGLGVQLATGARELEPGLWISLLWFGVVPLVLYATGALAAHALAGNRWLGLIGGLLLAGLMHRGQSVGLEHPLTRFGATPSGEHSGMAGYGYLPASFAAFVACWAAGSALLVLVGAGVWPRGPIASLSQRIRALPRTLGTTGMRLAAGTSVVFGAWAATLLHVTTVRHPWVSSQADATWRADYERAYRRLFRAPQPVIIAVRSTVRLRPEAGRAEIDGVYQVENRAAASVDTIWLAVPRTVSHATIRGASEDRPAHAHLGMHALALEQPLAPGARAEVRFSLVLDRGGVRASLPEQDVVGNGTVLMSGTIYPSIGYRPGWELDEPALRRTHGLDGEPTARFELAVADSLRAAGHATPWMTLETTIATAPGQVALGPGALLRQWDSAGRAWFRYAPDRPVTPTFAIASARYEVHRVRHGGVDVEVWHAPEDDANVSRIIAAATRTLDLLGARLAPYPHPVLRLAEVPSWWRFGAYATPTLILFPEDRGFQTEASEGDVDLVTRRVAHEVAHQWWGHGLTPLDVRGSTLLVETLAKDAEAQVIASMHGADALPAMLAFDEDRYFAGRASDVRDEPPLLEVTDQSHLYYGKGALMMHALRVRLGSAAVDEALRSLLADHGGPGGTATSGDLRDRLLMRAVSGLDSAMVDEWLTGRASYALRLDSATVTKTADGWRVRADLHADRSSLEGDAGPSLARDSVEVTVLDGPPGKGQELRTVRVPLRDGPIELDIPVATRPAWAVVDPRRLKLEAERWDDATTVSP